MYIDIFPSKSNMDAKTLSDATTRAEKGQSLSATANQFFDIQMKQSDYIHRVHDGHELLTPEALGKVAICLMAVKQANALAVRNFEELLALLHGGSITLPNAQTLSHTTVDMDARHARLSHQKTLAAAANIRGWAS